MPVPADAAEAVIAEAEREVRNAARKQKRKAAAAEKRRRKQEDRAAGAAEQAGRRRAKEERQREEGEKALAALLERSVMLAAASGGSLLSCFRLVPDPRSRRGRRHSLPCILALVTAALLSGQTLLEDVTAWISHADPEILAAAGARRGRDGRLAAPHGKTVTRVLGMLGAQALADAAARYLAAALPPGPVRFPVAGPVLLPSLNCDGKEIRGATAADGTVPFLLSGAVDGVVIAEREIGAKTNEIPEIGPMLLSLSEHAPLAGRVITADALHTQRRLAKLICEQLLAHYVLTVKDNQKGLHAALAGLNWARARRHVTRDHGHGRDETRTHLVMDAPASVKGLFPHVRQIARVTRDVTRVTRSRTGKTRAPGLKITHETVYIVTSLTAREAAPKHIAAYVRGHWGIENKVHWVRDVTLREDPSRVSAGSRPRVLATLRNLAMGLIRQAGHDAIAGTIRQAEYDKALLLAILRLTPAL
jgi:predicted transposase YbfD/YdcC